MTRLNVIQLLLTYSCLDDYLSFQMDVKSNFMNFF